VNFMNPSGLPVKHCKAGGRNRQGFITGRRPRITEPSSWLVCILWMDAYKTIEGVKVDCA